MPRRTSRDMFKYRFNDQIRKSIFCANFASVVWLELANEHQGGFFSPCAQPVRRTPGYERTLPALLVCSGRYVPRAIQRGSFFRGSLRYVWLAVSFPFAHMGYQNRNLKELRAPIVIFFSSFSPQDSFPADFPHQWYCGGGLCGLRGPSRCC